MKIITKFKDRFSVQSNIKKKKIVIAITQSVF